MSGPPGTNSPTRANSPGNNVGGHKRVRHGTVYPQRRTNDTVVVDLGSMPLVDPVLRGRKSEGLRIPGRGGTCPNHLFTRREVRTKCISRVS